MGKYRDRTFTGCWKCRARKIKCDGTYPGCLACARLGVPCTGYGARYVWVENDGHVERSDGRRLLSCETTWRGFQVLSSDLVDLLIAQCDDAYLSGTGVKLETAAGPEASHNPFSVFPATPASVAEGHRAAAVESKSEQGPLKSLSLTPRTSQEEYYLFQYYLERIGGLMLPYEHPKNPWKNIYPAAAAASRRSADGSILYHAMLAHAAFHLAYVKVGDTSIYEAGPKYYDMAIVQLLNVIRAEVGFTPVTLAAILSLMYAEVYRGRSRDWTHHYYGAWGMMGQLSFSRPEWFDDLSKAALQSLGIAKIIGDTSRSVSSKPQGTSGTSDTDADRAAQASILATSNFGFTIGADSEIMGSIARITEFCNRRAEGSPVQDTEEFVADTLAVLNRHRHSVESDSDEVSTEPPQAAAQRAAFVYATYIYLYRAVLDVTPHMVRPHVSKTFAQVSRFFARSSGNFSFWPAFVAAAEAYTDKDIGMAREWLNGAVALGLGNRVSAQRVLEEVWKKRGELSQQTGLDLGSVIVDWRAVMQRLETEILLI